MSTKRMVLFFLLATLASPWLFTPSASSQGAQAPASALGFDGDGYGDLAIGVPGENPNGVASAGAAHVLYGGAAGLESSHFLHQGIPGVGDSPETSDEFGLALASGDLNGDGYGDLAAGVPMEGVDTVAGAGAVNVLYGAPGGFSGSGQFWHQNSPGAVSDAAAGEGFGRALATGDLNGDRYADLAIGVPWEDVGTASDAGAVHVFYGSSVGLTATDNHLWDQDQIPVAGPAETDDQFGRALATGDFDGDGYDDLAIGARFDDLPDRPNAGNVVVLYGSAAGLTTTGSQLWDQNNPDITGEAEVDDLFGDALAAGDLNGDGFDDLAVGIPHKDLTGVVNAGAVLLLYGGAGGLRAEGNQLLNQDVVDVPDQVEEEDLFGQALAIGDLDGDGYEDLAVGVPFEDVEDAAAPDAGVVNVLYGAFGGLSGSGSQLWYQGLIEIFEHPETADNFGYALAIGDLNGDGYGDLAAGVPGEGYGAATRAGAVQVIYGSSTGLTDVGDQLWHQDQPGVDDQTEVDDFFGFALTTIEVTAPAPSPFIIFLPTVLRNH